MSNKTIVIIQARVGSSRLPGKVLKPLGNSVVLDWVVNAARNISGVDEVIVATTQLSSDDAIEEWCNKKHIHCFRGSEKNVLSRYYTCAKENGASAIMRITADCPLLDHEVCEEVLNLLEINDCDYVSNASENRFPHGLDCEAFTFKALEKAFNEAETNFDKEHVTPYIIRNNKLFSLNFLNCPIDSDERWTLDYKEDYLFLQELVAHLNNKTAPYRKIIDILDSNSELRLINDRCKEAWGKNMEEGQ